MAELPKDASPVVLSGDGFSAPQSVEFHVSRDGDELCSRLVDRQSMHLGPRSTNGGGRKSRRHKQVI